MRENDIDVFVGLPAAHIERIGHQFGTPQAAAAISNWNNHRNALAAFAKVNRHRPAAIDLRKQLRQILTPVGFSALRAHGLQQHRLGGANGRNELLVAIEKALQF